MGCVTPEISVPILNWANDSKEGHSDTPSHHKPLMRYPNRHWDTLDGAGIMADHMPKPMSRRQKSGTKAKGNRCPFGKGYKEGQFLPSLLIPPSLSPPPSLPSPSSPALLSPPFTISTTPPTMEHHLATPPPSPNHINHIFISNYPNIPAVVNGFTLTLPRIRDHMYNTTLKNFLVNSMPEFHNSFFMLIPLTTHLSYLEYQMWHTFQAYLDWKVEEVDTPMNFCVQKWMLSKVYTKAKAQGLALIKKIFKESMELERIMDDYEEYWNKRIALINNLNCPSMSLPLDLEVMPMTYNWITREPIEDADVEDMSNWFISYSYY